MNLKIKSIIIILIIFIIIALLFPFGNTWGGTVKYKECDRKAQYFLESNFGLNYKNIIISQKINSKGILEIDSIIWSNCGRKPNHFNYNINNSILEIKNNTYYNLAHILLDDGILASCNCPHHTTYYISNYSNIESVLIDNSTPTYINDEKKDELLKILQTENN